ncbi:hypothetical protein Aperf_G00000025793 [Anoplocephala perfoliata]
MEDIICGVCSKPINDPYRLPCGHTFCLRPCLLAHAKSVTARCIYCKSEFCASELRQDYSIGARVHSKQFEKSENNGDTTKTTNSQIGSGQTQCTACRKPMEAEKLEYCQHCYRSVCSLCLVKHFDSFSLSVRVKLTALTRQKLSLSSELQNLKDQSRTQLVPSQLGPREGIVAELDGAIAQLSRAASKALDSAMAQIELSDGEGSRTLNEIADRLLANFRNIDDVHGIHSQLEGNKMKLPDLAKTYQRLKSIQDGASVSDDLPVAPVTLLKMSKRFYEIIDQVAEFSLLVLDDPAALSTILASQMASCDRVDVAKTGSSNVKLYVGGLRKNHTEEHLRRHFESVYGPLVDCYVARDYETKVSKCYGFVTFRKAAHASRALEDFPHFIEGSPIQVRPYKIENDERNKVASAPTFGPVQSVEPVASRQRTKNHGDQENSRADSPSGDIDELRLFVSSISPLISQTLLKEYFSKYGTVTRATIILERKTGKPRGMAFVNMATKEDVKSVLDNRPHSIDGKQIVVRPAHMKAFKKNVTITTNSQLIIHDIPTDMSRQDLLKCFSSFGGITDLRLDVKRHLGFLSFSSTEAFKLALDSSPHQINGNYLRVSLAKPGISSTTEPTLEIQVGDISSGTSAYDLVAFFSKFGSVLKANVITKNYKRIGFVKMSSYEAVKSAMNAKAPQIDGNYVTIREAFSKEQATSHRSKVRLAKANRKATEIKDSKPVNPQKINKTSSSQEQRISQLPRLMSTTSEPSTSTNQVRKLDEQNRFSFLDFFLRRSEKSEPSAKKVIDPVDSDNDSDHINSKDADLGDGYWYDSD